MATIYNPDGSPKSLMQIAAEQQAAQNVAPVVASVTTAPTPGAGQAPQVAPVFNTFDESKGVAGRVASLTAKDSPLMQQAATRGTQIAAARGLTNSSLAAEASQNAVLSAATPIATADASLYSQAQLANQNTSNVVGTTNAQLQTQAQQLDAQKEQFAAQLGMQGKDLELRRDTLTAQQKAQLDDFNLRQKSLEQQQSQFDTSTQLSQKNFEATQTQQLVMQQLDQTNKIALANIEAGFKEGIQGNINIASAWQTLMQNVQAAQNNPNLDAAAKQTLIQNNLDAFSSFAKFWNKQTAIDIGPLLDFGVAGGAATTPGSTTAPAPGATVGGGGRSTIPPGAPSTYEDLYPAGH